MLAWDGLEPAGDPFLDIALELGGSLEPREVIERILEAGLRAVSSDRATLSSLAEESLTIEATAGRDGSVTWIGHRYSMAMLRSQPAVAKALLERQVVLSGPMDVAAAAAEFRDALTQVRHTATLPLVHQGQVAGLLVLSRYEDVPFTRADTRNLTLLSTIAGMALRNAGLYELAQASAARLRSAVEAAEEVASELELTAVLDKLLSHAVAAAEADNASLSTVDGPELTIQASTSANTEIGARYPLARAARQAVMTGRPVQLTAVDYKSDQPAAAGVVGPYGRFLVVPLSVGGTGVGLVILGRKRDEAFSEEQVASVQQFSPLAALLVRNARLLAEAREANRTRNDFVNMAVHELRSPLGVIRGYVSMLEAATIREPDQSAELLATIGRMADTLNGLVDELQLAARLESGLLAVKRVNLNAHAAAEAAIQRAQPRSLLLGGQVRMEVGGEDLMVSADVQWLGRILDNLLNNAMAYSPAAPDVTLSVRPDRDRVIFSVSDLGAGIAEEDRLRIFDRFVRSATAQPGMGLGLYLSRALAEMMSGSLSLVSSSPGEGSTFALELPLA